ncbi:DUF4349 domain-containing protein [Phycicoccus sp. CSK15P-2]|uniref:DUF4349 domain-containing protein n=1 Tax=Phycicoccus sp. CSK15P-2 TaxID=2807627 RepID=UPI00194EE4FA|nr:DUF4349 domain-containing protein [Phycicoccus sp. CSK15P-2]MBM6403964.1 DUF4349 domain-containing protein [Phycicoccus sp. CSK15P-2]
MPSTARPTRPTTRLAGVAASALLALAALTACSGAGDQGAGGAADSSASDVGAVSEQELAESDAADPSAPVQRTQGAATTDVAAAVADRKLARRAAVSLEVADIAAAADRLRVVAAGKEGIVVAEEMAVEPDAPAEDGTTSPRPSGYGTVTIAVPTDGLDATLDEVAKVGTVLSRTTSTDDVTAQLVDTTSRVKSMQASVDRVRALMADATELSDVVALEAELSRRQADLEALQQQLAGLEDRVALSPVTVNLSTPGAERPEEDPTGFLAGLAAGWDAFTTSVRLLLTLLGALLPFAVAGALVVLPLVVWLRRRRTPATATPPPAAPSA